ncbi:MAG: LysR substrate-binding domain-containing protein [Rickettsiales bacterium]|nr:LysR substrate-binding domain-containing protein [Rickettsiales bacterium]
MITDVGVDIVQRARNILQEADEIRESTKNAQNPFAGVLKIGAFPTLAPYFFPSIIPKLNAQYPDLKLFLVEDKTEILIERLKKGTLDAAFLAVPLPQMEDSLEYKALFKDDFMLATPLAHPLARRKSIKRDDLLDQSLLLLEEGHCLRDQALDVCFVAGISEDQHFRATSLETLRQMVASNLGVTLIPKLAQKTNDHICYIPFKDHAPYRTIGMVWRKTSARKVCFEGMIQTLGYDQDIS